MAWQAVYHIVDSALFGLFGVKAYIATQTSDPEVITCLVGWALLKRIQKTRVDSFD